MLHAFLIDFQSIFFFAIFEKITIKKLKIERYVSKLNI